MVCAAALPPEPRLTVKRSGDPTSGFGLARGGMGSGPTLPIPLIVGVLLLLITIGLLLILFAQGINPFVEPTPTVTSTPTLQPTFTAQPTRTPTSTPTSTPLPPLVHKVQEADSCIRLAAIYNVAVQSILQLNSFAQACPLYVGQEVLVPQPTLTPVPTGTSTLPAPQLTQESRPTHAVLAGESLSSIAALYAINFNVLAEVNGKLPPDYAISIGEVLRIPL
ncbi:MAG: LysM peptidoglycan-binding domain-containing protein, partial [Chloroflexi bacterium]|nr:LysM peptidoglycan-binding domain-containing protein [Chloroflexota bacterium]